MDEITLSANAILTVDELKVYQGQADEGTAPDANRSRLLINITSDLMETFLGRKVIEPASAVAEIFDGDGEPNMFVKEKRCQDSPAPVLAYRQGDNTWTELSTSDYPRDIEVDRGEIVFTQGHAFAKGLRNYRVTYKYGWAQTAVPSIIKLGCLQAIQRIWDLSGGKEGVRSETTPGLGATTYSLDELIPEKTRELLIGKFGADVF